MPLLMSKISPLAMVDPAARVADDVEIGPFCTIGPDVELGPGDRATFAADGVHTYQALDPGTRAIIVLSYR